MKGRYANLRRIEELDPTTDYDEIFQLVAYHEFPWEVVQGTSIAFLRDYGVPTISDLLDRTGRFAADGQEGYDAGRTYPFGYSISDLGPRDVSAERHRHAESVQADATPDQKAS